MGTTLKGIQFRETRKGNRPVFLTGLGRGLREVNGTRRVVPHLQLTGT